MSAAAKCTNCDDYGWVCEEHPGRPWSGPKACPCGSAGMPCPVCNPSDELTPPRMPEGFVDDDEMTRH